MLAEPDRAKDATIMGTIDLPKSGLGRYGLNVMREIFQNARSVAGCFDRDWIEGS